MIKMEIVRKEGIDKGDLKKKLIDAELKIWKKIEDIAFAVGKHPDEVYVDLMIEFSEFVEKRYPTMKYPNEKTAKEQIRKREVSEENN
jgi:hypothetical protein